MGAVEQINGSSRPKHALADGVSANKAQHWEVFRLPLTKTKTNTTTGTKTKTMTKTATKTFKENG